MPTNRDGTYAQGSEAAYFDGSLSKVRVNGSYAKQTDGSSGLVQDFKMIGQDKNTTALDTWRVTGTPDFTGAFYAGGLATPLRHIAVAASWEL